MARYQIFNPADYKMVNGKLTKKTLPSYQSQGQVNEVLIDTDFPYTAPDGTSVPVDRYKRTLANGDEIIVLRKSSDQSVYGMKNRKTGRITTFNSDGYGYDYDPLLDGSGNPVLDASGQPKYDLNRRGAGYIGDQWYEEDWEGQYVNTSKKFKDLMNDPKSQDMIDAMYDDYKNIVNDPLLDQGKFDEADGTIGYWNPRNAPDAAALANLRGMTKEDFVQNLIRGNEETSLISSIYADSDFLQDDYWDKSYTQSGKKLTKRGDYYRSIMEQMGRESMDDNDLRRYEASYQAMQDILQNPEFLDRFKKAGLDINPTGVTDQSRGGRPITYIEGDVWPGDTYIQQRLVAAPEEEEVIDPPEPGTKTFYYCIEDENGKRVSEPITVKEGESPTPPDGAVSEGYEDLGSVQKICEAEGEILEEELPAPDTWFGNDIRNYLTAVGQKIYKGRPNLYQMGPAPFGYALESPDSLIAATTGMSNQYNNLLANTMSGNAAAAASLGAQGTFLNQIAQDIGAVNTRNVDRLNTAYGQRSQLDQDTAQRNLAMRKTFGDESAIFGQNLTNAQNAKRALMTEMYNKGEENRYNDELLRYLYPQAKYPNRFNMGRTWDASGNYKDPLEDASDPQSLTTDCFGVYEDAYNQYMQSTSIEMDDEKKTQAAQKFAENAQRECYARGRNNNQTRSYAQAALNQRRNPMIMSTGEDGGSIPFGASYGTPWGKKY